MSSLGSPNPFFIAGKKAYEVERSLRFNSGDSPNLARTFGSSTNVRLRTISVWVKRSKINDSYGQGFFQYGVSGAGDAMMFLGAGTGIGINDQFRIGNRNATSGSGDWELRTNRLFRDVSAWYHIVVQYDTTQSTASDRVKLYVNGVQETSFAAATYPSQDYDSTAFLAGTGGAHNIGYSIATGSANYFGGYLAEFNFIDGYAYDASYFGETNVLTGQWNPKKYTGSYGNQGFYLNFSDNSGTTATTLGKDSSGNGNNYTPNNFSVSAGEGNDSVEDTPTNNWCTLNPLDPDAKTLSEGNLKCVGSTGFMAGSNFIVTSGKWYMEVKYVSGTSNHQWSIGFSSPDRSYLRLVRGGDGELTPNTGTVAVTFADPDVIMVALDVDNGKWYIGKNGSYMLSGDPVNGTGFVHSGLSSSEGFMLCMINNTGDGSQTIAANFGQQGFTYTPPTDFKALNSANLPDPTIKLPDNHFNTLLYTGDGSSTRTLTGVGFKPDWTWKKERNQAYSIGHMLYDSVRGLGVDKHLDSSTTLAEGSGNDAEFGYFTGFTSDGFSVSAGSSGDDYVNDGSNNYVTWNWNAGDTDGKTYTVTVVDSGGNKYRFDGFAANAVTLDLAEGGTYIFNYPSAHPLKFSTTADGTHGGGSEYTTGVTHNSSTQVTIVVAASAPTLYYYCSSHSGMGGAINTNSTLGSSNFDGTIQSTVKVNATAGFSIVSYTGTGSNATIGHGLGVAPSAIILKARDRSDNWWVYHKGLSDPATKAINLNLTNAEFTPNTSAFNPSAFTSSVFGVLTDGSSNASGEKYIAYCFNEVSSYSKFGSYTGNANTDGTFVFTGFRPAWVLLKKRSGTDNWGIFDNKRDVDNPMHHRLRANLSDAEATNLSSSADQIDFLSNGFKLRTTSNNHNGNGATNIFLAFAESPFKNARAR